MKKLNFETLSLKNIMRIMSFVLFTGLVSCGSSLSTISSGKVATEGVTIREENGAFTLTDGKMWDTPFQTTMHEGHQAIMRKDMTGYYDQALELGAKKVRVKTQYTDKELYGILALNKYMSECSVPVTRSYQISVPEEYVLQAMDGQVSVLYEYYDCGKDKSQKTWVLWLSDVPF